MSNETADILAFASLTELMNGAMRLDIDGDLFKVTIRFPVQVQLPRESE